MIIAVESRKNDKHLLYSKTKSDNKWPRKNFKSIYKENFEASVHL